MDGWTRKECREFRDAKREILKKAAAPGWRGLARETVQGSTDSCARTGPSDRIAVSGAERRSSAEGRPQNHWGIRAFASSSLPKKRSSLLRSPRRIWGTALPWAPRGRANGSGLIRSQRRKRLWVLSSSHHPGSNSFRSGFRAFQWSGPLEGIRRPVRPPTGSVDRRGIGSRPARHWTEALRLPRSPDRCPRSPAGDRAPDPGRDPRRSGSPVAPLPTPRRSPRRSLRRRTARLRGTLRNCRTPPPSRRGRRRAPSESSHTPTSCRSLLRRAPRGSPRTSRWNRPRWNRPRGCRSPDPRTGHRPENRARKRCAGSEKRAGCCSRPSHPCLCD